MITLEIYFTDRETGVRRDQKYLAELSPAMLNNAVETVRRANLLIEAYTAATGDKVENVNSGWRPKSINDATEGASKTSRHLTCEAVDLRDLGDVLDKWLDTPFGVKMLEECNLWREHNQDTHGWCHLQTAPYPTWTPGRTRTFYAKAPR